MIWKLLTAWCLLAVHERALCVSNAIAIVMLFLTDHAFGTITGRHPWPVGLAMVVLGSMLVGMTMALGG